MTDEEASTPEKWIPEEHTTKENLDFVLNRDSDGEKTTTQDAIPSRSTQASRYQHRPAGKPRKNTTAWGPNRTDKISGSLSVPGGPPSKRG